MSSNIFDVLLKPEGHRMHDPRHCDDFINDPLAPPCLRAFLEFNRRPAINKIGPSPFLFARLKIPKTGERGGRHWMGEAPTVINLASGQRVRVVMASRFGDVGVTERLGDEHGYVVRVHIDELCDFSETERGCIAG